jgi:hypothetical protein
MYGKRDYKDRYRDMEEGYIYGYVHNQRIDVISMHNVGIRA